jgi:hypothetical protein
MKSKTILPLFAILIVLSTLACTDTNDLGVPCTLIKKDPITGESKPITEQEAREKLSSQPTAPDGRNAENSQDLISLGVPECEDLACVRDAQFDPGPVEPSANARGYCSIRCSSDGSTCKASSSKAKYVCRLLTLDEEILKQTCEADPSSGTCKNSSSTLFCAQEK